MDDSLAGSGGLLFGCVQRELWELESAVGLSCQNSALVVLLCIWVERVYGCGSEIYEFGDVGQGHSSMETTPRPSGRSHAVVPNLRTLSIIFNS